MTKNDLFDKLSVEELEQVALGNTDILKAARARKAKYSSANMGKMSVAQLTAVSKGTPISEIQDERNEFVGIAGGLGGALTGASIGTAILPGFGTAIGGIIGGAVGAFGGELAEDALQGKDLDYANATFEGAISAGIDVATLGTFKFAKPIYFASKRALGFTPNQVSTDLVSMSSVTAGSQIAGSAASLKATQEMLETTGGTLTPSQVGGDGILAFYENMGRNGILSSKSFNENAAKANQSVSNAINDLAARSEAGTLLRDDLGKVVNDVILEGQKALRQQYTNGFNAVLPKLDNVGIDITPIYKDLGNMLNKHKNMLSDTSLEKSAYNLIEDLQKDLSAGLPKIEDIFKDMPTSVPVGGNLVDKAGNPLTRTVMTSTKTGEKTVPNPVPAKDLLLWQKKVNDTITKMVYLNNRNEGGIGKAHIAQLSSILKKSIDVAVTKASPEAAGAYSKVKKLFRENIDEVKPNSIKGLLQSASKESYDSLGKVLLNAGSLDLSKFKRTWGAIRYSLNNIDPTKMRELGFTGKEDALKTIRSSYVRNIFPDVNASSFDIKSYANKMIKMSPEEVKQAKVVMGESYPQFNRIRNAIIDASKKQKNDVGILSLRAKELAAITALGSTGYFMGGDTGGTVALGGIGILFAPKVMARIALNPKQAAQFINVLGRSSTTQAGINSTEKALKVLMTGEAIDTVSGATATE
tara:strand:- start:42 stop:2132 length:2091 start_codon:yes stop_codon:yes gene_type:complete